MTQEADPLLYQSLVHKPLSTWDPDTLPFAVFQPLLKPVSHRVASLLARGTMPVVGLHEIQDVGIMQVRAQFDNELVDRTPGNVVRPEEFACR